MVDTFGVFEKDFLGSCYDSFLNERLAQNQLKKNRFNIVAADHKTRTITISGSKRAKHYTPWYSRVLVSIDLAIIGMKLKRLADKEADNG